MKTLHPAHPLSSTCQKGHKSSKKGAHKWENFYGDVELSRTLSGDHRDSTVTQYLQSRNIHELRHHLWLIECLDIRDDPIQEVPGSLDIKEVEALKKETRVCLRIFAMELLRGIMLTYRDSALVLRSLYLSADDTLETLIISLDTGQILELPIAQITCCRVMLRMLNSTSLMNDDEFTDFVDKNQPVSSVAIKKTIAVVYWSNGSSLNLVFNDMIECLRFCVFLTYIRDGITRRKTQPPPNMLRYSEKSIVEYISSNIAKSVKNVAPLRQYLRIHYHTKDAEKSLHTRRFSVNNALDGVSNSSCCGNSNHGSPLGSRRKVQSTFAGVASASSLEYGALEKIPISSNSVDSHSDSELYYGTFTTEEMQWMLNRDVVTVHKSVAPYVPVEIHEQLGIDGYSEGPLPRARKEIEIAQEVNLASSHSRRERENLVTYTPDIPPDSPHKHVASRPGKAGSSDRGKPQCSLSIEDVDSSTSVASSGDSFPEYLQDDLKSEKTPPSSDVPHHVGSMGMESGNGIILDGGLPADGHSDVLLSDAASLGLSFGGDGGDGGSAGGSSTEGYMMTAAPSHPTLNASRDVSCGFFLCTTEPTTSVEKAKPPRKADIVVTTAEEALAKFPGFSPNVRRRIVVPLSSEEYLHSSTLDSTAYVDFI